MKPEQEQVLEEEEITVVEAGDSSDELDKFLNEFDDEIEGEPSEPAQALTDEELEIAAAGDEEPEVEQVAEPSAEAAVPETPVEPVPPEVAQPLEEEVQPPAVESPEIVVPVEPQAEPPAESTPQVDIVELRAQALSEIEQRYAISEEDAQMFATDPDKVLPKLAAQVYMDAYDNIMQGVMSVLPQMIHGYVQSAQVSQEAEQSFFKAWNKLDPKNPTHRQTVERIGGVYRQLNPKAPREQFIAEVGAQALLALGIPFQDIVDAPVAEVQTPFTPAGPGSAPVMPKPKTGNAFEDLAEEFLNDSD